MDEIIEIIQKLPNGKASGLDGFTAAFFKTYVNGLLPLLLDMYDEYLTNISTSNTQWSSDNTDPKEGQGGYRLQKQ